MPTSPLTPGERFAIMLRWLSQAVAARMAGGQISASLIALIISRICTINQQVARLITRIAAGHYAPRRSPTPSGHPIMRGPRQQSPLPRNFGWLLPLLPDAVGYRSQLEYLLRDPETADLLARAPAALARPLRSLCWMLSLRPPPILAPPPPTSPPPAPQAAPHAPPSPSPPRARARSAPVSAIPVHACGPPLPA